MAKCRQRVCNRPVSSCLPFQALRREDPRLLAGAGCFVHDVQIEGMQHVAFVRSTVAHGRLDGLSLDSMSGVTLLTRHELGVHQMPSINPLLPLSQDASFPLLGYPEVSYVGQPLAVVIAPTRDQARRAAERVQVKISSLPAQADFASDAPVMTEIAFASESQLSAEELKGSVTVSTTLRNPRLVAMSLEPRAAVAQWHEDSTSMKLWLPTQTPSRAQSDVAACLGLALERVQVIAPDVGGAFGAKASVCPEDLLVALAAKFLKTTLSWQASRSEEMTSGMQGRGSVLQGSLCVDTQGRLLSLETDAQFTLGAWLPFSALVPLRNAVRILPGPYVVPQSALKGHAKRSHAAPVNIYRGAGRPEAALLMETLMGKAADALQIDPIEFRLRNLIESAQMPFSTSTGQQLDSGRYAQALMLAKETFGWANEKAIQAERRSQGERVGLGVALYIEPCGQGWESARVTLHPSGKITVASGSPSQGQGHATSFAQIAFDALKAQLPCSLEDIDVVYGDTSLCPEGVGSLASRSTAIGGSAIVRACQEVLAQLKALPSQALQAQHEPLIAEAKFTANESWSYGCVIARMAVDADTGEPTIERMVWADDAGKIISPALAKGQLLGGLAQGLGQAMMEQIRYDAQGQLLTGSLMDYAVPRAVDLPHQIEIVSMETPSPHNLLGAKGVGEAGCIGVPAALMNAARNALQLPPEHDLNFPLTAETLWRAMSSTAPHSY
jgi:aerobic carbon-monoxide dehydrogenase large subunit